MPGSACAEALRRGHRARQAGDVAQAIAHYREALAADPASAEANGALGLMLLRAGDVETSSALLQQAVSLAPGQPAFRMNLAELHARRGELPAALALVKAIVAEHPDAWWAFERLGELQGGLRQFDAARDAFSRALSLRPGDPALLYKLSRAEFDRGDATAADVALREASARAPGHEAVLGLQAELLASRADWAGLDAHARDWLSRAPGQGAALRWLARAQWESGLLADALRTLQAALHAGPRDLVGLATLARLALLAQDDAAAAAALEEAQALAPEAPQLLQPRAIRAMQHGDLDRAEALVLRALQHDAADVAAWKTLVQLRAGRLDADGFTALHTLAVSPSHDARDRASACFALGDCLDAAGDHAGAFAMWREANALQAALNASEGLAYDASARERETDGIIAAFRSEGVSVRTPPAPLRPVFIVGMPRSGTTLLESVLGAHPEVLACGERAAMRTIMRERMTLGRAPREDELVRWRGAYVEGVAVRGAQRALIDKNPWNFDAVALIAQLFPEACILHLVRDAEETALSIFRNEFPKFAGFANRLEDIAHYRAQYERLMQHWDALLPGRVLHLRHEELVADFDRVVPAVLAHCGLAWDERCRDFARPGRAIATLSTVQVRQPLGSVPARASRYRQFL